MQQERTPSRLSSNLLQAPLRTRPLLAGRSHIKAALARTVMYLPPTCSAAPAPRACRSAWWRCAYASGGLECPRVGVCVPGQPCGYWLYPLSHQEKPPLLGGGPLAHPEAGDKVKARCRAARPPHASGGPHWSASRPSCRKGGSIPWSNASRPCAGSSSSLYLITAGLPARSVHRGPQHRRGARGSRSF